MWERCVQQDLDPLAEVSYRKEPDVSGVAEPKCAAESSEGEIEPVRGPGGRGVASQFPSVGSSVRLKVLDGGVVGVRVVAR